MDKSRTINEIASKLRKRPNEEGYYEKLWKEWVDFIRSIEDVDEVVRIVHENADLAEMLFKLGGNTDDLFNN